MVLPRILAADQLEQQSAAALRAFVNQRLKEGTGPYEKAYRRIRPIVEKLFASTNNLHDLNPSVFHVQPALVEAARYLGGPPLSQDDLDTLSGGNVSSRKKIDPELASKAVEAIEAFLDPFRFSWLSSHKKPTKSTIQAAIDWTTSLWAVEKCKTARRGESSALQEKKVAAEFRSAGLQELQGIRRIESLDELPRAHFTSEIILGVGKADLAVRLNDGRLLAVECKVSNSALNSVKRLNRETVGKAERWRTLYGQQVITAAVLAGVFKVSNLMEAQGAGLFIFWEHELTPLREFVEQTSK